jgi:phosphate transport system permease protein
MVKKILKYLRNADKVFSNLTLLFALLIVVILIGMMYLLYGNALPAIREFGLGFIWSMDWNPNKGEFGALPALYGTLLTSAIGLIIAVPISLGAAVFLVELAPRWLSRPCSFLIEMLAAIPSVIIGLWGIFILLPSAIAPLEEWLNSNLGFVPLFGGQVFGGLSYLAAGIILAIMIMPIITAMSRDVMRAVPNTQREATKWETIRKAVIPYCRSGLVGAVILGLGRALGETMAVTMVIGNNYSVTKDIFSPGTTISSKIASNFNEASSGVFIGSLVYLALVLFAVTLMVNVIARLLVWRLTAVKAGSE